VRKKNRKKYVSCAVDMKQSEMCVKCVAQRKFSKIFYKRTQCRYCFVIFQGTYCQIYRTQYMLLAHADVLLCLQQHTVVSPYTVHASNLLCLQQHTVVCPYTVHASNLLCLQQHTVVSPYTVHASNLLCLQLHTVVSPYTVHASNPR
jgi:hypothetical protein